MTTPLRKYALGIAALAVAAAGCRGKETDEKPAKDILAVDTMVDLGYARPNQNVDPDPLLRTLAESAGVAVAAGAAPVGTTSVDTGGGTPVVAASVAPMPARRKVSRTRREVIATSDRRVTTRRVASASRPRRTRTTTRRTTIQRRPATEETRNDRSVTISDRTQELNRTHARAPGFVLTPGSQLSLASTQRICTNTSHVGDRFNARLSEPLVAANGQVIPAGARAIGEVASLAPADSSIDGSEIGLTVNYVMFDGKRYPVVTEVTNTEVVKARTRSPGATTRAVTGGAAVGGILGQVVGKSAKGAVIGAVAGGAAGAAVASRGRSTYACVPNGGRIIARITEPLTIAGN